MSDNNVREYGQDQIQVLEGLEAVRKRPECILAQRTLEDCII